MRIHNSLLLVFIYRHKISIFALSQLYGRSSEFSMVDASVYRLIGGWTWSHVPPLLFAAVIGLLHYIACHRIAIPVPHVQQLPLLDRHACTQIISPPMDIQIRSLFSTNRMLSTPRNQADTALWHDTSQQLPFPGPNERFPTTTIVHVI